MANRERPAMYIYADVYIVFKCAGLSAILDKYVHLQVLKNIVTMFLSLFPCVEGIFLPCTDGFAQAGSYHLSLLRSLCSSFTMFFHMAAWCLLWVHTCSNRAALTLCPIAAMALSACMSGTFESRGWSPQSKVTW